MNVTTQVWLSNHRRSSDIRYILLSCILFLFFGTTSFSLAQKKSDFLRRNRSIELGSLDIRNPKGLTFSPDANSFLVVEPVTSGKAKVTVSKVFLVSHFGDLIESVKLTTTTSDPVNIALDNKNNRLVMFKPSSRKLIVIDVDTGGRPKKNPNDTVKADQFGLDEPQGVTVDPATGDLYVLDNVGPRILRIIPDRGKDLNSARISEIDLSKTGLVGLRGIAFDPSNGHLQIMSPIERRLYEVNEKGVLVANRDLADLNVVAPQAMTYAPSGDLTDDSSQQSLYIVDSGGENRILQENALFQASQEAEASSQIVELSLSQQSQQASSGLDQGTLIQTIDTSQFSLSQQPLPSPDPAGITYNTISAKLLISDSEVEEIPTLFANANLFEATVTGSLTSSFDLTGYTLEPTGITFNPLDGHYFISDDDADDIFEVDSATMSLVRQFETRHAFGSNDPEGIAYDPANGGVLYIVDGLNQEVYRIEPGADGIFNGVPPAGDDLLTSFDTQVLGIADPEGIAFDSDTGHLYIVGFPKTELAHVSTSGVLLRRIDISAANVDRPAGLAYAPGSQNAAINNIYISDRGDDNDSVPNENDGMVYEFSVPPIAQGNMPPTVDAGLDQSITILNVANLNGNVSDDNLPIGTLNVFWSQISGPGTANFSDPTLASTTTSFSAAGTYVLRLTADDSQLIAHDDLSVDVTGSNGEIITEVQVSADSDDAEQRPAGTMLLNSSDLELVSEGGENQTVGIRFNGINIPPQSAILSAYIQFTVDEVTTNVTNLTIHGEAVDNASTFIGTSGNITGRELTTTSVAWSPAPWPTIGEATAAQRTSNIASIIQEIVNRGGWSSGNSLVLIISGGNGERTAVSYDGDPLGAPLLHVEHVAPGQVPSLEFSSASSTTSDESAMNHQIVVTLHTPGGGVLQNALSVDVVDNGSGTASAGVDYTSFTPTTLTFPAGSNNGATQAFTLVTVQDDIFEEEETVDLRLDNLQGSAILGPQLTHTVRILDEVLDPNLVGFWPFDKDNACAVKNIVNGIPSVLSPSCPGNSPASTTGQAGNALEFDGNDDFVDIGVIELGDPLQLTSGGTLAVWMKPRPGDRWQRIVDKSTAGSGANGYALIADPLDRSIWLSVKGANYKTDGGVYEFNQWAHIAAVITGATFAIYIDGVQVSGTFHSGNARLPPNSATTMRIGTWNHAAGREFNGFLDDLRIYNRALTATEIGEVIGEVNSGSSLIAHYELDEGVGCTAADTVNSSESKTGSLEPNCTLSSSDGPIWSTADSKSGNALEFDGNDDYVDLGVIETGHPLQLTSGGTLAVWMKPRAGDRWQRIVDKSTAGSGANGYALIADPLDRSIWLSVKGANYKTGGGVYEFNQWAHIAAVITGATFAIYIDGVQVSGTFHSGNARLPPNSATTMRIGTWNHAAGREFNGFLDDLRIYNRALTVTEIGEVIGEVNSGSSLIAHYELDEGVGCTAADTVNSSESKTGSLKPNCTLSSSDGPIWSTADSKSGNALEFDGNDDYVDLGVIETGHPLQLTSGGTLAVWMKPRAGDRWQRIVDKSTAGSGANGYALIADPLDRSIWLSVKGANYRTGGGVYEFNQWAHIAAVITGATFAIYIDGVQVSGTFHSGNARLPPNSATTMRIGTWNHAAGREFNGFLDDLRIYNVPLTGAEIIDLVAESSVSSAIVVANALFSDSGLEAVVKNAGPDLTELSRTVYEDGEDGAIDGWGMYGDGKVVNMDDASGNRVILTESQRFDDPFRLGLADESDWDNTEEFTAFFTILMEEQAAVYFRIDTTVGEMYLCYTPAPETLTVDDRVLCFSLGVEPGGQWHTVQRNLAEDLRLAMPDAELISVKDLYVFGDVQLDDIMLIKFNDGRN